MDRMTDSGFCWLGVPRLTRLTSGQAGRESLQLSENLIKVSGYC